MISYGRFMRQGRLKVPLSHAVGYYHCMSRVVDRQFIFTEDEKERLHTIMRDAEIFCGVKVLTFGFMDNHFHLVVEVPRRPQLLPSAEELIGKLKQLKHPPDIQRIERRIANYRQRQDEEGEKRFLGKYWARMWDISQFMKEVKQRYSQSYNRRHERKGTLWEERFKSVVVEGDELALLMAGLYVDLNSVRAGKVKDPKDYRWSGYGRAVGGDGRAREGIRRLVESAGRRPGISEEEALREYRMALYRTGDEQRESLDQAGKAVRGVIDHGAVLEVLRNEGRLDMVDYVTCRIRYLSDGAVLGGRRFMKELIEGNQGRIGVRVSDREPPRVAGLRQELYSLRKLGREIFG